MGPKHPALGGAGGTRTEAATVWWRKREYRHYQQNYSSTLIVIAE